MSRIGILPISIPDGVTVEIGNGLVTVKGPKGELSEKIHELIKVEIKDNEVICTRKGEDKFSRSLHGLSRNLINNMVEGVTKGFEKRLEIIGVGYKAQAQGSKLTLNLGFSHPIEYKAPEGITFENDKEKKNIVIVSGISKQMVGEVAAKIKSYRKPEPYKGKGIRYEGEYVARKAGKAIAKTE
jgi:large subunit ribosomal protein L6